MCELSPLEPVSRRRSATDLAFEPRETDTRPSQRSSDAARVPTTWRRNCCHSARFESRNAVSSKRVFANALNSLGSKGGGGGGGSSFFLLVYGFRPADLNLCALLV